VGNGRRSLLRAGRTRQRQVPPFELNGQAAVVERSVHRFQLRRRPAFPSPSPYRALRHQLLRCRAGSRRRHRRPAGSLCATSPRNEVRVFENGREQTIVTFSLVELKPDASATRKSNWMTSTPLRNGGTLGAWPYKSLAVNRLTSSAVPAIDCATYRLCCTYAPAFPKSGLKDIRTAIASGLFIRRCASATGDFQRNRLAALALRLRRTAFLAMQGFGHRLWVLGCHPQKRQGRTVRSPATLFPVLQRRHADTNHQRKFTLRRAEARANSLDVLGFEDSRPRWLRVPRRIRPASRTLLINS